MRKHFIITGFVPGYEEETLVIHAATTTGARKEWCQLYTQIDNPTIAEIVFKPIHWSYSPIRRA